MLCELCRRSKGVKINSVNIQHNEALQKLAKNIRGEQYKPTQETQLLEICEQCEQNVMKKFKSESIEESFKDNNTELRDFIMNTEEVKPKKPKIEKDTLADDNIQQRQESALAEDKCSIKDNIATIKTKEISNSVSNEAELEDNTKTECQEALHDSVEVFDIIVKEEPRLNDIDDDDDDDDDDDPDQMMTENNEDSKKNITSENSISTSTETAVLRSATIKERLLNGEYTFNLKRGRSKIWDTFSKINDADGKEITETVACKMCYGIYKFAGSSSNLVKHKCYAKTQNPKSVPEVNVDKDTKQEGIKLATEWTVKNCRPFKLIEDSGLKKLAKFLIRVGANFGANVNVDNLLPDSTTISRNISALYETHFALIKEEILIYKCFGYAITSDIWTDNFLRSSYLSCSVHYIKEGVLINRLLSIKSMEEDSATGSNIKEKITQILRQFGCDLEEDKPIIVTDRGSNVIKAFQQDQQKIHCVNHMLHNIIEKAIKSIPELTETISKCSKLVKFFQKSAANSTLGVSLKSHCPTRWNTVYYLLDSIEKNWLDISNILISKNERNILDTINLSILISVVNVLSLFEEVSKTLEASNKPTIHFTIPCIYKLKKHCKPDTNDNTIIAQFKLILDNLLTNTVLKNLTIYHKIAVFLFPPANALLPFSEPDKVNIIKKCKEIMAEYLEKIDDDPVEKTSNISANNFFADFIKTPNEDNNSLDKIDNEIQNYTNVNESFSDDFDCIQWWDMHKNKFPLLFKTSCKILAAPASSAASERALSNARNLITEKRCTLATNADKINKIMFLHSNIPNILE